MSVSLAGDFRALSPPSVLPVYITDGRKASDRKNVDDVVIWTNYEALLSDLVRIGISVNACCKPRDGWVKNDMAVVDPSRSGLNIDVFRATIKDRSIGRQPMLSRGHLGFPRAWHWCCIDHTTVDIVRHPRTN
jgi:hypothetical protein